MRNRKVISLIISMMMLVLVCSSPFISYASFFVNDGDVMSCPGNTRAYMKAENYNYAWLDSVIVRDGSLAVTPLTVYPVSDYPYSLTAKEFVDECNSYVKLFEASDSTVQSSVIDSLKTIYYTLVATDVITDSNQDMRAYNESYGIVYPYTDSKFTDMYTAITYVCLNDGLYKLISDEDITITRGTTVEGAVVKFLSVACNMVVPSDVETISAFSYLFTEKYVMENSEYPVSENPSEEEVYYWVKLQAAQKAGYTVPADTKYDDLTTDQIEYVENAYYASILSTKYDAPINPTLLKAALKSSDAVNEVPKLVLKSMLDYVSVSYKADDSIDSLFVKACKEGFFDLENDFYTDIFNYNLYVPSDCEKVWITAFPIADQLENGFNNNVSTYVNGTLVRNSTTNAVDLGEKGATFTVRTNYSGKDDAACYTFNVIKTKDADVMNDAPSIDLSDSIGTITSNISNVIVGSVDVSTPEAGPTEGYTFNNNQLTTYPISGGVSSDSSMFETYPVDENGNVITTVNPLELTTEGATEATPINGMADLVRENPAVVAAPAGFLAISFSAGFIFLRKRKNDSVAYSDEE